MKSITIFFFISSQVNQYFGFFIHIIHMKIIDEIKIVHSVSNMLNMCETSHEYHVQCFKRSQKPHTFIFYLSKNKMKKNEKKK